MKMLKSEFTHYHCNKVGCFIYFLISALPASLAGRRLLLLLNSIKNSSAPEGAKPLKFAGGTNLFSLAASKGPGGENVHYLIKDTEKTIS